MAPKLHAGIAHLIWPLGKPESPVRHPWLTWTLLAVSLVLAWAHTLAPERIETFFALTRGATYQYLTYFFVHGNPAIFLLDALLLWCFAGAVEVWFGRWRMLALVLTGAVAGAAANNLSGLKGVMELSGASAVVVGLLGAALVAVWKGAGQGFGGTPLAWCAFYCCLEALLARLALTSSVPLMRGPLEFSVASHLGGLIGGGALALVLLPRPAAARPEQAEQKRPAPLLSRLAPPVFAMPPALDLFDPAASALDAEPQELPGMFDPPELDAPEQPETVPSVDSLFGDPSASQFGALSPKLTQAHKPTAVVKQAPAEIGPISFDETGGGMGPDAPIKLISPEPPEPQDPPTRQEPETRSQRVPAPAPPAAPARAPSTPPAEPARRGAVTVRNVSLSEYTRRDAEPEIDTMVKFSFSPSDETRERALALKDETDWASLHAGRFAVVLAPGRPHDLVALTDKLAQLLDLTPKGAAQSLAHRHGILADNLVQAEAERLAGELARAGHAVLMVALTSRVQFGEALELVSLEERGEHLHLATAAGAPIVAAWRQFVFLATGRVAPGAGVPSRRVLDLFLIQPRHHLRLWEHAFTYSPEAPGLRELTRLITGRASAAFHTRSLDNWLKDESAAPHQFAGIVEYDHYLRWHLLANLAPARAMSPD